MVCKNCGTNNEGTARFCSSCGSPLEVVPVISNQDVVPTMVSNPVTPVNMMKPATKQPIDIKRFIVVGLLLACVMMMLIIVFITSKKESSTPLPVVDDGDITRTVMIYMVGADLESESGIASADLNGIKASEIDLDKMNVLLYTGGTMKWHNFVSSEDNAIYQLTESGFEKKKTYEKSNMGDANTLSTLLNYAYDNYKTDEYDLIFYNHGGAIDGAIYDQFSGDNLSIADMGDAFNNSPFKGDNKLEVITFRTCLNGTLEVASELDDYADYLVASEEVTNGDNTSSVLSFLNNIESSDSAIDYGKKFISEYEKHVSEIDPLGMGTVAMYAVIDLSKIDSVVSELGTFVSGIDLTKNYADIIRVRGNLYQYGYSFHGDGKYDMVDLYTLAERINDYSAVSNEKLITAINNAVVYNWTREVQESHGLSVYFPYKGSGLNQYKYLNTYNDIDFSEQYVSFIKKISSLVRSNKNSSFSKSDITESKSEVTKGEFSLELTNDQAKDFAEAKMFIVKIFSMT